MRIRYSFSSRHTGNIENIQKQKQKFPKVAAEVIRISDIILEILDARFINETRNLEAEKRIKNNGKKIIYVLNKSDLIDLNTKTDEVELLKIFPYIFVSCKQRKGISKLRQKIKIEVKKLDMEGRRAQIGIIGYPNTGKSSLINLLSGRASAKKGAEAGFTKGMQKIRLNADILLIDTPGVIPKEEYSFEKQAMQKKAKLGAMTLDKITDPELVVFGLMKNYSKEIGNFYNLDSEEDFELFLEKLGRKMNFLSKGGIADLDRTSRKIIDDWQKGKIRI